MGRILMRLVALAIIGAVAYKALQAAGVIGGEESVEFEWADDAN